LSLRRRALRGRVDVVARVRRCREERTKLRAPLPPYRRAEGRGAATDPAIMARPPAELGQSVGRRKLTRLARMSVRDNRYARERYEADKGVLPVSDAFRAGGLRSLGRAVEWVRWAERAVAGPMRKCIPFSFTFSFLVFFSFYF
jgi:hypothetical protein